MRRSEIVLYATVMLAGLTIGIVAMQLTKLSADQPRRNAVDCMDQSP